MLLPLPCSAHTSASSIFSQVKQFPMGLVGKRVWPWICHFLRVSWRFRMTSKSMNLEYSKWSAPPQETLGKSYQIRTAKSRGNKLTVFIWSVALTIQVNIWINGANSQGFCFPRQIKQSYYFLFWGWRVNSKRVKSFRFSFMKTSSFFPLGLKTFVRRPSGEMWKYWVRIISDCERQSGLVRRLMNSTAKGNPVLLLIFCVSLYPSLKMSQTCSNCAFDWLKIPAPSTLTIKYT